MYLVSQPCTYVQDGGVIIHRKAGAVVELSDELAAELGDKVRLVGGDPDAAVEPVEPEVPSGQPVTFVEGATGTVLDDAVVSEPIVEPDADPVDESAKPRARNRPGRDG